MDRPDERSKRGDDKGKGIGGVRLTVQQEIIDYFIGRLIWENVASYKDINSWLYSPEELLQMHKFLDLKDKIERKGMGLSNGNQNN